MGTVTDKQFYEAMQEIRDLINSRANELVRKIDDHAQDDQKAFEAIRERVNTIEVQRDGEKGQAAKRATLTALVVSLPGSIYAVWKLWHP